MGKIYDALEKKDKSEKRKKIASKSNAETPLRAEVKEKVVQLRDKNQSAPERIVDNKLVAYHAPYSIEADLFKTLRTKILFPENGTPPKTILVTSALPGDGKSFVSSNFSISIASGIEENVLLMDCDIRKPTIHKCFGLYQKLGLSEYLSGDKKFTDIIYKSFIQKLSIIPSGTPPMNPTELLTSKKMQDLLVEVKKRYSDRYIIIDSPPPAMASETSAIAKFVDGIIIVVKAGKTPRRAVGEVVSELGKSKILGVIFNHAEQRVKNYYGHSKSYYGEKRDKFGSKGIEAGMKKA